MTTHAGDRAFLPGNSAGVSMVVPQEFHEFFLFLRKAFTKFSSTIVNFRKELPALDGKRDGAENFKENEDLRWSARMA